MRENGILRDVASEYGGDQLGRLVEVKKSDWCKHDCSRREQRLWREDKARYSQKNGNRRKQHSKYQTGGPCKAALLRQHGARLWRGSASPSFQLDARL